MTIPLTHPRTIAAAAIMALFALIALNITWQDSRISPELYISGEAWRPFVGRALLPMLARVVGGGRAALNVMITLSWLAVPVALGYLVAFFRPISDAELAALTVLPIVLLLAHVHIYDGATIALTAATLGALLRQRWAFTLALLAVFALNRETAILVGVAAAWVARGWRVRLLAVALPIAIRALIAWRFAGNPGGPVEFHAADFLLAITHGFDFFVFTLSGALMLIANVARRWPALHPTLRAGFVFVALPLLVSYPIIGYPFEFRYFLEVYPLLVAAFVMVKQ